MRFLHTSDWHLGRLFHQVSLLPDQYHVLEQIIGIAKDHQVDAILVAGDIYDRAVPPADAVALFNDILVRIRTELQIPVVIIAGNHDSLQRLDFASSLLRDSGVYVYSRLERHPGPLTLEDRHGRVSVYGLPYGEPLFARNLWPELTNNHDQLMAERCRAIAGRLKKTHRNILLAHCYVEGGLGSESERPLSIGGIDQVGTGHFDAFHYTALGHLHSPQNRGDKIRYSGSLLKYSFSESEQRKSVTIVDLDGAGQVGIKTVSLEPLREVRVLQGMMEDLIAAADADPDKQDYLFVKLLDRTALLDPMGRLRRVYPKLLHLERTGLMTRVVEHLPAREQLKVGVEKMFHDFYLAMTGEAPTPEQLKVLQETMVDLHQGEA